MEQCGKVMNNMWNEEMKKGNLYFVNVPSSLVEPISTYMEKVWQYTKDSNAIIFGKYYLVTKGDYSSSTPGYILDCWDVEDMEDFKNTLINWDNEYHVLDARSMEQKITMF